MSSLLTTIPPDGLRARLDVADWRGLVGEVGRLLVDTGAALEEYIAAMLASIEQNGPYLVIAPGLALLHARPEDGALRPGLVLATTERPVEFGHSTNDPVRVALGLTAVDADGHLESLAGIATVFSQPGAVDRIAEATSTEDLRRRLLAIEANG